MWRALRGMKYKRDSLTKCEQAEKAQIRWKYWNLMQFPNPFTSTKRTSGNLPQFSEKTDKRRWAWCSANAWATAGNHFSAHHCHHQHHHLLESSFGKRRRKELAIDLVSDREEKPDDADQHFLKGPNAHADSGVKIKIQQLLQDAEYRPSPPPSPSATAQMCRGHHQQL